MGLPIHASGVRCVRCPRSLVDGIDERTPNSLTSRRLSTLRTRSRRRPSIRGMTSTYVPVHEDWIWNVILPAIAYGTWLAAGFCIWRSPHGSLYAVAAVLVLLMLIGIHNAWDIAVWNSTRKDTEGSKETGR